MGARRMSSAEVVLAVVDDLVAVGAGRGIQPEPVLGDGLERRVGAGPAVAVAEVDEDARALHRRLHAGPGRVRRGELDDVRGPATRLGRDVVRVGLVVRRCESPTGPTTMTTFALEAPSAGRGGDATRAAARVARAAVQGTAQGLGSGRCIGWGSRPSSPNRTSAAPPPHGPVRTRHDRPAERAEPAGDPPTMGAMARLPARTGADVHLADSFGRPGCPLCRERSRAEAAYLEAILAESVNDVPFRQALDAGRGFCAPHSRAVLDADRRRAGSLGAGDPAAGHAAGAPARARGAPCRRRLGEGPPRGRRVAAARVPGVPARRRGGRRPRRGPRAAWRRSRRGGRRSRRRRSASSTWWRWSTGGPSPDWWPPVEERQLARLREILGTGSTGSPTRRRTTGGTSRRPTRSPRSTRPPTCSAARRAGPGRSRRRPDARTLLVTGVYGAGKTTVAVELSDRLAGGRGRGGGDRPRLARLVRGAGGVGRARGPAHDPAQPRRAPGRVPRGGRPDVRPRRRRPRAVDGGAAPRRHADAASRWSGSRSTPTRSGRGSPATRTRRGATTSRSRCGTSRPTPADVGAWSVDGTRAVRPRWRRRSSSTAGVVRRNLTARWQVACATMPA